MRKASIVSLPVCPRAWTLGSVRWARGSSRWMLAEDLLDPRAEALAALLDLRAHALGDAVGELLGVVAAAAGQAAEQQRGDERQDEQRARRARLSPRRPAGSRAGRAAG